MKIHRLQSKLLAGFFAIAVFASAIAGWQSFEISRNALERATFDHLTSIREIKRRQVESYIRRVRSDVSALAGDPALAELLLSRPGAHARTAGPNGHDAGAARLRAVRARHAYGNVLLTDTAGRILIAAVSATDIPRIGADVGTDSIFARAFRSARAASSADSVFMTDFAFPPGEDGPPRAFVAAPVRVARRTAGILVVELSNAELNREMTGETQWKRDGLGTTGETYIVGADGTLRTESRFFVQNRTDFVTELARAGRDTAGAARMRRTGTSVLNVRANTVATRAAFRGAADTRILEDYRGVPVLSSFAPIGIPDVRWAMLAEMDVAEAFRSVYTLREQLILFGLTAALVAAVIAFLLSRTISRPVAQLAAAAESFGAGERNARAPADTRDEIGVLARAFNRMADNIARDTARMASEIEERARAEAELLRSRERLRSLSTHLQNVREEERKGVAREIHDELGQALTTLKLNVALLRQSVPEGGDGVRDTLAAMNRIVDDTIRSVKRIITELRPGLLDDLGLLAAVEWLAEEFGSRTGIRCEVSLPDVLPLSQDLSTALFRIVQETLTNAARHAGARTVRVTLAAEPDAVSLVVEDDGRGITESELGSAAAYGVLGMRERVNAFGGSIDIVGVPGRGTTVTVALPLSPVPAVP